MRLVDARTKRVVSFVESKAPPYAILSHTWEEDEVSLEDMQNLANVRAKRGYYKIEKSCDQALSDGLGYVWIDTCCIDKSSSAELSKAINSMYRWYKNSRLCYAYLCDVKSSASTAEHNGQVENSRWFRRGWTLQELLAPTILELFDHDWIRIGGKADLSATIAKITKVDEEFIVGADIQTASVSKRMSWAADRETTEPEDLAYCLLGIFQVNMPLLYGEGERAFIRLQEEIMKDSDDQTIFAWGTKHEQATYSWSTAAENLPCIGLLACSPSDFRYSGNCVPSRNWTQSEPYSLTNKGLRIRCCIVQTSLPTQSVSDQSPSRRITIMILDCKENGDFVGLRCMPLSSRSDDVDQYARIGKGPPIPIPLNLLFNCESRTVYVRKSILHPTEDEEDVRPSFIFNYTPDIQVLRVHPNNQWDESKGVIASPYKTRHKCPTYGPCVDAPAWHAIIACRGQSEFQILVGFSDENKDPYCCLYPHTPGQSLADISGPKTLPSSCLFASIALGTENINCRLFKRRIVHEDIWFITLVTTIVSIPSIK